MSPIRRAFALPAASDTVFDEIAALAAELSGAAHAAITLFDGALHRPVAAFGAIQLALLPRDSRFCCEVLHSGAPLEVSDALFDLRFHADPLVTGGPRVRFYAGVPLLGETGETLGTLSVLDPRPKVLGERARAALWKLADVVVRLVRDLEARREAEETLAWQASHDALTGLENRRGFEARLAARLEGARRAGERHALLYIDLDEFKVVNDTCGHAAGDALLRELAALLAGRLRGGDAIARLGGDEFGMLVECCDLLHAQRAAAQVLAAIRGLRFQWHGQVFTVGASIGLAPITADSLDAGSVMAAADTACYLAKDKGRNQVHVLHPEDEEIALRRGEMGWVARIARCAEEDRFFLHCQRVVPLGGGGDEYLELLLRMRAEDGRIVPPSAFIPAAERFHSMGTIDRWVVRRALKCLAALHRGGSHPGLPRFGINLSGTSLGDPAFADFVLEAFQEGGPPPAAVCFEITETAAISNLERAARFIARFRELGCRFALDDFGAGLSSFAYLKSLPVDYLKIDGSFIRGSAHDRVDLAAVDAIQRLAAAVGARTIAESVESEETRLRLQRLGIDFGQGFALHAPEPYVLLAARSDGALPARGAAA